MTTHQKFEFTRPGAHSAKNARQAGAPNHLMRSGETPMVGTHHTQGHAPDRVTVEAVRRRLNGQTYRFVTVTQSGQLAVHMDDLAMLIAEIVTDITLDLQAQLLLALDSIDELARDVDTAVEGGGFRA